MLIRIQHRTSYRYLRAVAFGPHELRLWPRLSPGQRIETFALKIRAAHKLTWIRDHYENTVGLVTFTEATEELVFEMDCTIEITEKNPFSFRLSPESQTYPFRYLSEQAQQLEPWLLPLFKQDLVKIREWIDPLWQGRPLKTLRLLQAINKKIYQDIRYLRREVKGVQGPGETLDRKSGACRDFAALFVESARGLGLAARFVSGYLHAESISGPMSMHAWAEVYLPGAGWIGFDPSWGILCTGHYVPVAVTRHPEHAPPICGTYYGTARDFQGTRVELFVTTPASPSLIPLSESLSGSEHVD